jgi:hypothetical protein
MPKAMNVHPRKSRFLLAPLTGTVLALGGWLAAPAMAATGNSAAGSCCHAKAASPCCEGACCQSQAPNPEQAPADPLATSNEGPQDFNFVASGFVPPRGADTKPSASHPCRLPLSGTGNSSLTAQHVRLQI